MKLVKRGSHGAKITVYESHPICVLYLPLIASSLIPCCWQRKTVGWALFYSTQPTTVESGQSDLVMQIVQF